MDKKNIKNIVKILGCFTGAAAFSSPLGGIMGTVFGDVFGEVIGKLLEGSLQAGSSVLSNISSDAIKDFAHSKDLEKNHDLQKALILSIKRVLENEQNRLKNKMGNKKFDEEYSDYFKEWIKMLSKSENDSVLLDSLLSGETSYDTILEGIQKDDISESSWNCIENILTKSSDWTIFPQDLNDLKKELKVDFFKKLNYEFLQVLKDPRYERSWIAFQYNVINIFSQSLENINSKLDNSSDNIGLILNKINLLSFNWEHLSGFFDNIMEKESENKNILETFKNEQVGLLEKILNAIDEIKKLTQGHFIELQRKFNYNLVEHDDNIIRMNLTNNFAGRDKDIKKLEGLILNDGYYLITSPAGGGKTTLISHFVNSLKQEEQNNVCYHFISRIHRTHLYNDILLCICEQLLCLYNIKADISKCQGIELQTIINKLLSIPFYSRLIIIIDGLDEACNVNEENTKFDFPKGLFPEILAHGITVLFSIRSVTGEETREEIQKNLGVSKMTSYELLELNLDGVKEMLEKSLDERLIKKANDITFLQNLLLKTGGLPIYLKNLIEELEHEDESEFSNIIDKVPSNFFEFVKLASEAVFKLPKWRDALRFMSIAKGPLKSDDLIELTTYSLSKGWSEGLQEEDIDNIPWNIRRWISIDNNDWVFQHKVISEAYAEKYLKPKTRNEYISYFINYCACWEENNSLYALGYYAQYLFESQQWDSVFKLVDNNKFAERQIKYLDNGLKHVINNKKIALKASTIIDNATMMAKYTVDCSRQVYAVSSSKILIDAIENCDIKLIYELADKYDNYSLITIYLITIWEFICNNKVKQAQIILDYLEEHTINYVEESSSISNLLICILDINEQAFDRLYKKLIKPSCYGFLINSLINYKKIEKALEIIPKISKKEDKIKFLKDITLYFKRNHEDEKAIEVTNESIMLINNVRDNNELLQVMHIAIDSLSEVLPIESKDSLYKLYKKFEIRQLSEYKLELFNKFLEIFYNKYNDREFVNNEINKISEEIKSESLKGCIEIGKIYTLIRILSIPIHDIYNIDDIITFIKSLQTNTENSINKDTIMTTIYSCLLKESTYDISLIILNQSNDIMVKTRHLIDLSEYLLKIDKIDVAKQIIIENFNLITEISKDISRRNNVIYLAKAFINKGDTEMFNRLYKSIPGESSNIDRELDLFYYQCKNGQFNEAYETKKLIDILVKSLDNNQKTLYVNNCLRNYSLSSKVDYKIKHEILMKEIINLSQTDYTGLQISTLNAIGNDLYKKGFTDVAYKCYKNSLRLCDRFNDERKKFRFLAEIINSTSKNELFVDSCIELLKELVYSICEMKGGVEISYELKLQSYLIECLKPILNSCKNLYSYGKIDEVNSLIDILAGLVQKCSSSINREERFGEIVNSLVSLDRYEDANLILNKISYSGIKIYTMLSISKVLFNKGKKSEAEHYINLSLEIFGNNMERMDEFIEIALTMVYIGNIQDAYDLVYNIINKRLSCKGVIKSLSKIINVMMERKEMEYAIKIVELIDFENIELFNENNDIIVIILLCSANKKIYEGKALLNKYKELIRNKKLLVDNDVQYAVTFLDVLFKVIEKYETLEEADKKGFYELIEMLKIEMRVSHDNRFNFFIMDMIFCSAIKEGLIDDMLDITDSIKIGIDRYYISAIKILTNKKDYLHFKKLLIDKYFKIDVAFKACSSLVELYEDQAEGIIDIICNLS